MFCTTFYSFKGGVGRTLALANVAAQLSHERRRVLVVDFDLEAPGLTTLPAFQAAADLPGMVEFVSEYVESGNVPPLDRYVHPCEIFDRVDEATDCDKLIIDVMPAGSDADGLYAGRLAKIDWNKLYAEQEGFLLMEELRAAWKQAGYDYVLIDSRTGLTDVGGICARQLPDAVVAVFFPNEQNLIGLKGVVEGIRHASSRPHSIKLMFVGSRVPRLDDENGDLRRQLARFAVELKYDSESLVLIEQYDSLMLLNQELFVLKRPNTGLARQYRDVALSLKRLNLEDADGALSFVSSIAEWRANQGLHASEESEIIERLKEISRLHEGDSVVQYALARAYYRLRSLSEAAVSADKAIATIGRTKTSKPIRSRLLPSVHRIRARIMGDLDRTEEALASADAILQDASSSSTMVIDALNILTRGDRRILSNPLDYPALQNTSAIDLLSIGARISESPAADFGSKLAEIGTRDLTSLTRLPTDERNQVQLMLVTGRHFDRAVELVGEEPMRSNDLMLVFNTAMAKWGRDRKPDIALFERAIELFSAELVLADANQAQCRSLTEAVLGRTGDAERDLEVASELSATRARAEFSCWSYSTVSHDEFKQHLAAMRHFIAEGVPLPEVFQAG